MPSSQVQSGISVSFKAEHRGYSRCPERLESFNKAVAMRMESRQLSEEHLGEAQQQIRQEYPELRGDVISRQATIEAPAPITCIRVSCLWRYLMKSLTYTMILLHDKHRVLYAEKNRGKDIPLKYRTGEFSPQTFKAALWEIIVLKFRR